MSKEQDGNWIRGTLRPAHAAIILLAWLCLVGPDAGRSAGHCWLAEKRDNVSRLLSCMCDDSSVSARAKMNMQGYTAIAGPMPLKDCERRRAASLHGYLDCYVGKRRQGGRTDYRCFCSDHTFSGIYKMQQAGYTRVAGPNNENMCAATAAKYRAGGGAGGTTAAKPGQAGGGAKDVTDTRLPQGGGYWQMVAVIGKLREPSKSECYPEKAGGGEGAAYFSIRTVCKKTPGRFGGVAHWKRPPTILFPGKPFPINLSVTRLFNDKRYSLHLTLGASIEPVDIQCGGTRGGQSMMVKVSSNSPDATVGKTVQFKMPAGGDKPERTALRYCADGWSQQYIYSWVPKGSKGHSVTLPPMPPDPGPDGNGRTTGNGSAAAGGGCAPFSTVPGREAGEKLIWALDNLNGVQNQARNPTIMVLKHKYLVTRISTYHWNGGRGDTPGAVSLSDQTGRTFGPWNPLAQNPDKSNTRLYWMVRPNLVLPAGSYRILDSRAATWSNNNSSGYAGMTRVWGVPCD